MSASARPAPPLAFTRLAPDTTWNSRYLDAIVTELRRSGIPVDDADVARLSPLGRAHLNVLGRYSFTASQPPTGLRPLRDPAASDPDAVD
jgi:hypothetical protein